MVSSDGKQDNKSAEEPENLWDKILSEASRSVADRLESKHVLLLGDRNSGKSTLLARLQGLDISELQGGIALDYSFIDIHSSPDADEDPVSRVNVWQLEGEPAHKDLLHFAINQNTINNCMVLINLDFSQPWNLVQSLNKWLDLVKKHISLIADKMELDEVEEMKRYLIYDFQQYTEPTGQPSSMAPMKQFKKRKPVDEQALLPLSDGVLTNNIGIPIVVVCSKSDTTEMLEKEYAYKEAHFDFIQQYLRRICLSYGAALIYTSAKKDKNCDVLLNYLRHKLYGFDFLHKLQLVEKDTILMPAGADSMIKIQVDFENQNLTKDPEEPYDEVIKLPKRLQARSAANVTASVVAEDDQEFLSKHKEAIEVGDPKPQEKKAGDFLKSPVPTDIIPPRDQPKVLPATHSTLTPEKSPPPATTPSTMAAPGGQDREHQVLADFFNSLIHKDRGPVANVTGGPRKPAAELAKDLKIPPRAAPGAASFGNRDDVAKQLDRIRNKYQKET
jgi:dynein light intermediate chain 1